MRTVAACTGRPGAGSPRPWALVAAILFALTAPPATGLSAQEPSQERDPAVVRALERAYDARRQGRLDEAIDHFETALERDSTDTGVALDLGYTLIEAGRTADAARAFELVTRLRPDVAPYHAQLGYLYLELGRLRAAAEAFESSSELDPADAQIALQLGYLLSELGDHGRARPYFAVAAGAEDDELRESAEEALEVLAGMGVVAPGSGFAELYLAPLHQTRFSNLIVSGIGRAGISLLPEPGLDGYLISRVTRDTRSEGGEQPQIFSDNALSFGVGLRARPWSRALTLYAEVAIARALDEDDPPWVPDHRFGAVYSESFGDPGEGSVLTDVYVDVAHYVRFENTIGYVNVRPQWRVTGPEGPDVDLTLRLGLIGDTDGDFFNNLVELAPGLRVTPFGSDGPTLVLEYALGRYLRDAPRGRSFTDFRTSVVFSAARFWPRR